MVEVTCDVYQCHENEAGKCTTSEINIQPLLTKNEEGEIIANVAICDIWGD